MKTQGWKNWGDFLGTGNLLRLQNRKYRSFKKAKKICPIT
jgi:hypothetical protein